MTSPKKTPPTDWNWQGDAACQGMDVDLFFAQDGERERDRGRRRNRALAVCAHCPLATKQACLEHALTMPEHQGVWGGMTEEERETERRSRRKRAAA
jgi:WhiB family redox-sensing transcriptional regulator